MKSFTHISKILERSRQGRRAGFTIVELLIVIVVIGILALIAVTAVSRAQDDARVAKVNSDLRLLEKAIMAARENSGETLFQITGNGCTRCACPYSGGNTTPYNTLAKTHACWTNYYDALTDIGNAAETNLSELRDGDPWGTPYILDENELELSASDCRRDQISSAGKGSNINVGPVVGVRNLRPFASACV
ncbi:type II secretion system protein [Candidatus Saccharibacteria bacterium]|nr:type II secretion system protein [Candidatus Saccharibacteria bacterium]